MLLVFDCVNTIIFVVLAKIFLELFLRPRQLNVAARIMIMASWILMEILIVNVFEDIFILKAISSIGCTVFSSLCLFQGGKVKKCALSVIHYGAFISVEFLVYMLAIRLTSYVQIYDVNKSLINVFGGVISAVMFILLMLLIRLLIKREDSSSITGIQVVQFLVFPIASISLTVAFAFFGRGREVSNQEIRYFIFLATVFLITNVYMYWLLKVDVDNRIMKEKTKILEIHAKELSNLYAQIKEEHREIAGIEHEYKNHLAVISSMLMSGDTEELKKYIQNQRISPVTVDVIDTGNAVCSAVFNAKYAESVRKGIQVRFDINNLECVQLKNEELVVILSNLFNNAIEACENCESEKMIEIKMNHSGAMLFISFSNSYKLDDSQANALSRSLKESTVMHGHGLSNIRRIVSSYGGQMDVLKEDTFTVRIIIPQA